MKRPLVSTAILLAGIFAAVSASYSADLSLGIDGGISMTTGRTYGDYFDAGYAAAGNLFCAVHTNISLGGHVRYHRWNATSRPYDWTCADGSLSALEIVPAVRFHSSRGSFERKILLLVELGAGYASVDSDAVSWTFPDLPGDTSGPEVPIATPDGEILLNLGVGASIVSETGFGIELLPTLHYLPGDEALLFVSFDLGFSIGI